jgi:hypothetical protein
LELRPPEAWDRVEVATVRRLLTVSERARTVWLVLLAMPYLHRGGLTSRRQIAEAYEAATGRSARRSDVVVALEELREAGLVEVEDRGSVGGSPSLYVRLIVASTPLTRTASPPGAESGRDLTRKAAGTWRGKRPGPDAESGRKDQIRTKEKKGRGTTGTSPFPSPGCEDRDTTPPYGGAVAPPVGGADEAERLRRGLAIVRSIGCGRVPADVVRRIEIRAERAERGESHGCDADTEHDAGTEAPGLSPGGQAEPGPPSAQGGEVVAARARTGRPRWRR